MGNPADALLQSLGTRAQMYRDKGANHTLNSERIAAAAAALGEKLSDYGSIRKKALEEDDAKAVADFEVAHAQVSDDPAAFMEDLGKLPTKTGAGAQLKLTAALRRQAQAEKQKNATYAKETQDLHNEATRFELEAKKKKAALDIQQRGFFKGLGTQHADPNPDKREPGYFGEMEADPMISDLDTLSLPDLVKRMAASGLFSDEELRTPMQLAQKAEDDAADAARMVNKDAETARAHREGEDYKRAALEQKAEAEKAKIALRETQIKGQIADRASRLGLDREKFSFDKTHKEAVTAETVRMNQIRTDMLEDQLRLKQQTLYANAQDDATSKLLSSQIQYAREMIALAKGSDAGYLDEDQVTELIGFLNKTIGMVQKQTAATVEGAKPVEEEKPGEDIGSLIQQLQESLKGGK